jgi:hypothetical protein
MTLTLTPTTAPIVAAERAHAAALATCPRMSRDELIAATQADIAADLQRAAELRVLAHAAEERARRQAAMLVALTGGLG